MRYIQDGRIYLAGSEGEVPAGVNLDRDFVQLPAVEFEIVNIARGVGCVKRKFSKTKSERHAR